MPAGEGGRQSFVVAGQAAEAAQPPEGSFHHPPPGQQHESPLGLMMLHDLQLHRGLPPGATGGGFEPPVRYGHGRLSWLTIVGWQSDILNSQSLSVPLAFPPAGNTVRMHSLECHWLC